MPFNFFKSKEDVDYKARLERKLCVARETPELIFDLSECNLKSVPSGVFSLCRVLRKEALFLQNNLLTSLSNGGALLDLIMLKVLDLHCNKMCKLPDDICALVNLENLNVSDNQLITLPDTIEKLKRLKVLNAARNRLKKIPVAIGRCTELQTLDIRENPQATTLPVELGALLRLQNLFVDPNLQFPSIEVVSSGTKAIISFLAAERGVVSPESDIIERTDIKSDTDYFLLQEKLKQIEERKEVQKSERLAWEKIIADENQGKEHQIQEEMKSKRSKLVEDIKIMQEDLEGELFKIQERKDAERSQLILQCLEVEENVNKKVKNILENSRKIQKQMTEMSEKERVMEEQLLFQIHSQSTSIEKSKVLDAMNELVKEEVMKAEKFRKYEAQRNQIALDWISEESELSGKLAALSDKARNDSRALMEALLADEEMQKAAVASLMEQSDARSWSLAQQVALVERQLAELTQVEIARRKLQQEDHMMDLSVSRVSLTELLMELFAQQQARRSELVAALRRMEGAREEAPSEAFWLEQYQRLLDSTSRQLVQTLEAVDGRLHQELAIHGVAHYLPLIANQVTSRLSVAAVGDTDLLEAGVTDPDDRFLVLKAFRVYLEGCDSVPSAPVNAYEASAPPLSTSSSSQSLASSSCVARSEEECVVCLDNSVNAIFLPCGHMCCCASCADLPLCPLCRATIHKVLQTSRLK